MRQALKARAGRDGKGDSIPLTQKRARIMKLLVGLFLLCAMLMAAPSDTGGGVGIAPSDGGMGGGTSPLASDGGGLEALPSDGGGHG